MTDVTGLEELSLMGQILTEVRELRAILEEYRPAMDAARKMLDNPAAKWRLRRDRTAD